MKAKRFAVGLLITLSGTLFGGCVSSQQYQEALAMNNRAQSLLKVAQEDAETAKEAQRQLELDLASMKLAMGRKDQAIGELTEANKDAAARFAELQRRYEQDTADLGPAPLGAVVALPAELDSELQTWAKKYGDLVAYDRSRGMVKFKTDLVFARGSDDVSPEAAETLKKFASIVQSAKAVPFHVYIAGHTDDVPVTHPATKRRHPNNWYLSVHRAVSVKDVLASSGLNEDRIGVMGFGKFHPVAPNAAGAKGNPLNRRVEIWIVPPERFLTTNGVKADEEKSEK